MQPRHTSHFSRSYTSFGFLILALLLMVIFGLALSKGAVPLSMIAIFDGSASSLETTVFNQLRAPRVFLSATVGASLAVSGAVLQGLFRNPLADPGLIGVSGGAALGAVAIIVFGSSLALPEVVTPYSLPVAAILGAMVVTLFLYSFSAYYGQFSVVTVLLAGIAINALSTVGIGVFQYLSDDAQLRTLVFWMMGSFGRANWITVLPSTFVMLVGVVILIFHSRQLDRLQLGEAEAFYLGVKVNRLKRVIILVSAVCVGAGVALSGIIGFVGLVVPHLVRLTLGVRHSILLFGSALMGASLMILADLVSRIAITPAELPVGLVTSALGAPFFLWLIARARD